jgi:hypothetical protein
MTEYATTRNQAWREHLAKVRALSQELSSAIAALEQNDLQKLEASLAIQEKLSHELAAKWPVPTADTTDVAKSGQATTSLPDEIRDAHIALVRLNRVYAAVLKRAQRSTNLMAAVYRIYGQGYGKDTTAVAKQHTWSCEV